MRASAAATGSPSPPSPSSVEGRTSPREIAAWKRTRASASSASGRIRSNRPGSPARRGSASCRACSRTGAAGCFRARRIASTSRASSASSNRRAWTTDAGGACGSAAIARSGLTASRSRRSSRSRWAVSRRQPSGLRSVSQRSGVDDLGEVDVPEAPQVVRLRVVADDSPDPPHRLAPFEVRALADLDRQIVGVLDRPAVHVADVQRPFGAVGEEDRAEPAIAAGQEFDPLARPMGRERGPVRLEAIEVHQVAGRVAREGPAAIGLGQARAPPDGHRAAPP